MSDLKEEIGKRIKKLREERNWSQAELANRLFIDKSAVCKYESGSSGVDVEKLIQLAKEFDVSLDYLITGNTNYINLDKFKFTEMDFENADPTSLAFRFYRIFDKQEYYGDLYKALMAVERMCRGYRNIMIDTYKNYKEQVDALGQQSEKNISYHSVKHIKKS